VISECDVREVPQIPDRAMIASEGMLLHRHAPVRSTRTQETTQPAQSTIKAIAFGLRPRWCECPAGTEGGSPGRTMDYLI
jgi:hypothetical protein